MTIEDLYAIYLKNPSVQTDTRKLKPGDIFFALKGPNFNGNEFAQKALASGASHAVIDEAPTKNDKRLILVDDVLKTLQALALHHRNQFDIPFLAITGSNGKTTTKELIHAVLATTYTTYTTKGNLNNHIGVPLTILSVKKDAQMAVIEMGANHQREIASYCTYTLPTYGLITNCGKAHLEGFGGVEGVRKGKGELFDHLRESRGTAFVMWDYDYLREMSTGIRQVIRYGTADAYLTGKVVKAAPFLEVSIDGDEELASLKTALVGDYNLPNVLAAVTVGKTFRVPDELIKKAIEGYRPTNARSQLVERNDYKVILDAYNANPSSMKAAIDNFAVGDTASKIIVIGAMAELGEESRLEHMQIVQLLKEHDWRDVALVGGDFLNIDTAYKTFRDVQEAKKWFGRQSLSGTTILIKGSRSMQMEKLLDDQ
jgi:UDP-N-acetylmuramoyl-tripeptide--D-alanyl-D-alanine ligase